jgi:hypothetical protein
MPTNGGFGSEQQACVRRSGLPLAAPCDAESLHLEHTAHRRRLRRRDPPSSSTRSASNSSRTRPPPRTTVESICAPMAWSAGGGDGQRRARQRGVERHTRRVSQSKTLELPFTWRTESGVVRVSCSPNDDPKRWGCWWPVAEGFAVCTATVDHWRSWRRPGALGRSPGSICSPIRRLSSMSIDPPSREVRI